MRNEEGGDPKEFSDWAAVTPDFEKLANVRIEPLTAEGIAKGIDAKIEQQIWDESKEVTPEDWAYLSEDYSKAQWKKHANLPVMQYLGTIRRPLDKNGGPIEVGGVQASTAVEANNAYMKQIKDLWNQKPKDSIYEQPYPAYTRLGWSCPNCGRCYGPHINACTQCVGAYQYPYSYPGGAWIHPGGLCPPSQPFTVNPWFTNNVTATPGRLGVVRTDGPEPTSRLDV